MSAEHQVSTRTTAKKDRLACKNAECTNKRCYSPIILPCKNSGTDDMDRTVCRSHFYSNATSIYCPLCGEEHEVPQPDGFPRNEELERLLYVPPKPFAEQAVDALKEYTQAIYELDNALKDPQNALDEDMRRLRNLVDIEAERAKLKEQEGEETGAAAEERVNAERVVLFDALDEFERECKQSLQVGTHRDQVEDMKLQVARFDAKYKQWTQEFLAQAALANEEYWEQKCREISAYKRCAQLNTAHLLLLYQDYKQCTYKNGTEMRKQEAARRHRFYYGDEEEHVNQFTRITTVPTLGQLKVDSVKSLTTLMTKFVAATKIEVDPADPQKPVEELVLGLFAWPIEAINSNAFQEWKDSVRNIYLPGNAILIIDPETFAGFKELELLKLEQNLLCYLHKDTFAGLVKLKELLLGKNELKLVYKETFRDLKNLQELKINDNKLTRLESGTFRGLSQLQKLDLACNQIPSVDASELDDLVNLEELKLASNKLSTWHKCSLQKLTKLDLSCNQLSTLDSDAFKDLEQLEELYLQQNQLEELPSLRCLGHLKELYINENRLSHFTADTFRDLAKLERLWANKNRLKSFDQGIFAPLKSLMFFNLADNEATSAHPECLAGLEQLHTLYMCQNKLTRVERAMLAKVKNLRILSLFGNKLQALDDCTFEDLEELEVLNLGKNELVAITPQTFSGLCKLQELYLASNRISKIKKSAFDDLVQVQRIDMFDNPVTANADNLSVDKNNSMRGYGYF